MEFKLHQLEFEIEGNQDVVKEQFESRKPVQKLLSDFQADGFIRLTIVSLIIQLPSSSEPDHIDFATEEDH